MPKLRKRKLTIKFVNTIWRLMEGFRYLMYFYGFENQHLQIVLPQTSHRKRWLKLFAPSQETHPCLERNTHYGTWWYSALSFINIKFDQTIYTSCLLGYSRVLCCSLKPLGAVCVCWWVISKTQLKTHSWNYMQEITGIFPRNLVKDSSRDKDPTISPGSRSDDRAFCNPSWKWSQAEPEENPITWQPDIPSGVALRKPTRNYKERKSSCRAKPGGTGYMQGSSAQKCQGL